MSELWVEAKGHPDYLASNKGYIVERVTRRPVPTIQTIDGAAVNLWTDDQRYFLMVHRLIAASFWVGEIEGMVVNFKDGDVFNSAYWNLEVLTREENRKKNRASLSRTRPIRIRNLDTGEVYESCNEAGRVLGRASAIFPPRRVREVGGEFRSGGNRLKLV